MEDDQFKKKLEDILKWSEAEARAQSEINKEIRSLDHYYSKAPNTVKADLISEDGYFVDELHEIYLLKTPSMGATLSSANSSGLINVANHWAVAIVGTDEYKWSNDVIGDLSKNQSLCNELNSLKNVLSSLWPSLVEHVAKVEKYLEVSPFDTWVVVGSIRNLYIKIKFACSEILVKKDILNEHDKMNPMKILEEMLKHCGIDSNIKLIAELKLKLNDTFGKMSRDTKELTFKNEQEAKLSILKYLKDLSTFLKALDSSKF